jgi:membrane dipeptidase
MADEPHRDVHLERALRVLARVPLVDGHNDLPCAIREWPDAPGDVRAYDLRARTPGRTDLERLRRGRVGAQFWAVYVPCEHAGSARRFALEQITLAKEVFATYPEHLEEATTAAEVERVFRAGRIACLLGLEGGHAIEGSLDVLRSYHRLGVRYLTLTHNCSTDWADAGYDEPRHGGLSPFGVEVVREMNRLGMMVDLAHTSADTMRRALDVTASPVIWSHAGARALVDHPRNVPDDVLRRLPANGGVVMVTFVPAFVGARHHGWDAQETERRRALENEHGSGHSDVAHSLEEWRRKNPEPRASLSEVADHVEHVRAVAGIDHVGVGSDFDGSSRVVEGLEDVSTFPALFAELARRGWSDGELAKLAGENILRVMSAAEATAASVRG